MAHSSKFILSLLFVILYATLARSEEDSCSLDHKETTMVAAMKEVSQVLQCFGHTMQEGLQSLAGEISHMKENITQSKENSVSEKTENGVLRIVNESTNEIVDLRIQLSDKDKVVKQLSELNLEFKTKLDDNYNQLHSFRNELDAKNEALLQHTLEIRDLNVNLEEKIKENDQNAVKVQDLEWRLAEAQRCVDTFLQQQVNQTINTVKKLEICMNWTQECQQPHIKEISELVQEFNRQGDWKTMKEGLDSLLDKYGDLYAQLQHAKSLYGVAYYDHVELATLLLCAGLAVNTPSDTRFTLLHGAASRHHMRLFDMLMQRGANLEARDDYSRTPLLWAAIFGHLDIVQRLVQAGANTAVTDKWGYTALSYARSHGQAEVQQYLQQLTH